MTFGEWQVANWILNPRTWNADPYTLVWGCLATAIVTAIFGVFFWIKGKRDPF